MFRSLWTWAIPLASALAVFSFVLVTTPPGFGSLATLVFSTGADPAAYAAGAAASLALLTLVGVGAVCACVELVVRRVKVRKRLIRLVAPGTLLECAGHVNNHNHHHHA